jgi:hypothetical protein
LFFSLSKVNLEMPLTPAQIAEKQVRRTVEAVEDYRTGVANPRRNPIDAALAAEAKYKAKMAESLSKGLWAAALRGTPKDSASSKAASVGAERLAQGVQASADKISRFQNNFAPLRENVRRSVEGLPENTDAEREARMLANVRGMRAAKGQWRK